MKKVTYIVSDIDKALAFEWVNDFLNKKTIQLSFVIITKQSSNLSDYLKRKGTHVTNLRYTGKASLLLTFLKLLVVLIKHRPNVVHTHLFHANMLGLTAAWLLGINKRVFTRHHAMVHYNEFPSGLKWDKYLNSISTHIIAVSENVKNILISRDGANPDKVKIIHHGFDLSYFEKRDAESVVQLKEKYSIPSGVVVVGVISRYLELKGLQYVIPAFKELKFRIPKAYLLLCNTRGPYKPNIDNLLQQLPMGSYTEIEFENDLASLYQLFHVFLHVPIDRESEAFGQTYVEALASGVPSIFTLSGVAPEFVKPGINAIVVPYKDSSSILNAMTEIIENQEIAERLIHYGKASLQPFALSQMINKLNTLYHE